MSRWDWWMHSDAGLLSRITIGVTILATLALTELYRRGRAAQRWREYVFLLACVAGAMVFGAVNDLLTSRISWEYFYYGKELYQRLGMQTPPGAWPLAWAAALVGAKAAWSAGLIAGVMLLIANNPGRRLPQVPYRALAAAAAGVMLCAALGALIFGTLAHAQVLPWFAHNLMDIGWEDPSRERRFVTVYGAHLGAYIGGAAGAVAALLWVWRRRRRAAAAQVRPDENAPQTAPVTVTATDAAPR